VLPTKYYSGNKIKKNEMGRACGMYGVCAVFWLESQKDQGIGGSIILKWLGDKWGGFREHDEACGSISVRNLTN